MYVGQTLFAQLMDCLPWTTFARIVTRYDGDYRVRTLPCTEHFRILAFAQLTYRESLRDIEVCLAAQAAKLYHMGLRTPVKRATLAEANERRDWRIYADFAQRLITQARTLYKTEDLGLDLSNTVYAPRRHDHRPVSHAVSLGLVSPHQSGGQTAYLVGSSWGHSQLYPYFRRETARCSCPRSTASRAWSHLRHGPWVPGLRTTVHASSGRGLLCHPSQVKYRFPPHLFGPQRSRPGDCVRSDHRVVRVLHATEVSHSSAPYSVQRSRVWQDARLPNQPLWSARCHHLCPVQGAVARRVVFQMDQTASADQKVLWHVRECRESTDLDRGLGLRPCGYRQEAVQPQCLTLHIATDFLGDPVRETPFKHSLS